ncbi:MAG: pilus assembly protein PilP [Nitrospinae bacterium]|nr:pilus assembly protein PilP [Nitrospinota bacterium]
MKKVFFNNLVYVIIFISIFSVGCKGIINEVFRVIGREAGEKVAEKIFTPSPKKPPESDWKRYQLGSSDLYLDLPGRLEPVSGILAPGDAMKYEKFESYKYSRGGNFELLAAADVAKNIYKIDLNGAYEGSVANASGFKGVSEFQHAKKSTVISGREGLVILATLKLDGVPGAAKGLIITEGQKIWTIFIVYQASDIHEVIAQRIIDSVTIGQITASAEKKQEQAELKGEDEYVYNQTDKRDPFRSLILGKKEQLKFEEEKKRIEDKREEEKEKEKLKKEIENIPFTPLQEFDLSSIKIVAIIWGDIGNYAMVEAPDGKGYTIKKGIYIGKNRGAVKDITEDAIIIEEKYMDVDKKIKIKTVELKLKKEE